MLQKLVCAIEYMDDREKLNKTSFSEKEEFYCHLKMEDIAGTDYMHGKKVCKDFEIKKLGEYHDLHVQIDTLLLADMFENSRNMCLEITVFFFLLHQE